MDYFPNATRNKDRKKFNRSPWYKKAGEWIFNNRFGDWLDIYLMKLTSKRWKKKEESHQTNMKGGRMGLRTGRHFSKPNPNYFQKKLLELYLQKNKAGRRKMVRDL